MGTQLNGVDIVQTDVGDASAGTLGSLYAILGNWTVTLLAAIGYEGATALATKITAARAALLDQITAVRMAELDAANIPADVDTLLLRLTAVRAGYLDNLSGGAVALAASWTAALATALGNYTAARAGYLDNINQAGLLQVTAARAALLDQITAVRLAELDAANIPADIDTLLLRLTALRAGYLDNLSAGAVALAATALSTATWTAARAANLDLLDTAEAVGPFSYLDAGGEQDVYEELVTTRRHIRVEFSNQNMTQTGTFRIYRKVDGAAYALWASEPVLVAAGTERAFDAEFTTNQHWKLTYQENVDEAAARSIPYNVISQVVE